MAMISPLSHSPEVIWTQSKSSGMGGWGCQLFSPSSASTGLAARTNAAIKISIKKLSSLRFRIR